MKKITILLTILISQFISAQTKNDSIRVKETVTKYIESFYLVQPEKGQESVHRLSAWQTIQKFCDGSEFLKGMSYEEMVNLGKVFNLKGKYNTSSKRDIVVLYMMDKTASVKLIAEGWVDYVHVGKVNGEWKIINIL